MTRGQVPAQSESENGASPARYPVRSLRELATALSIRGPTFTSAVTPPMSFPTTTSEDHPLEDFKKKSITCICADLLIPGRGEPMKDAAAVLEEGRIAFVGPQSNIPEKYKSAPSTHVPVLLPGLWDCHTHFTGADSGPADFILPNLATCGAKIARSFHDTLMAGFTSIRDVGSFAIEAHDAVKRGVIYGPTVYGAGAVLTQTAGHGDTFEMPVGVIWRMSGTSVTAASENKGIGMVCMADGVDECRKAVRLQIRRGASLIKVLASGGVLSRDDDPLFQQFSDEELKVIVEEAGRMNRSVAAHVHGKDGCMAALRAGCHTLEHGSYLDDEAMDLMIEKGVMLIATRTIVEEGMAHLDLLGPSQRRKMIQVADLGKKMYAKAISKGVKCALGTDLGVSTPHVPFSLGNGNNARELYYAVEAGMTPLQAIEAATANAPETLGKMAPKSGQIREGYDADVIALCCNPLDDIKVFQDPKNITHVWKAGKISKGPGASIAFP